MTEDDFNFLLELAKSGGSMDVPTSNALQHEAAVKAGYVFAVIRQATIRYRLTRRGWLTIDSRERGRGAD